MSDEKAWLSVFIPVHPKGVDGVEVRTVCGSVPMFLCNKFIQPWLYGLCFVHYGICWNKKTFLELFPKSWKHSIVQNMIKCFFAGNKRPSSTPKKHPHSTIHPQPNCRQNNAIRLVMGICQTQTYRSDCQTHKCDFFLQRRCFHSSRVPWQYALHNGDRWPQ